MNLRPNSCWFAKSATNEPPANGFSVLYLYKNLYVNCCSNIVYRFTCRLGETDLPVDDIAAVCLLVNILSLFFILN